MMSFPQKDRKSGFTLIELSIVLVIIGLIVGAVLVGQDLIRAAGVRATITQITRYNQAVNTFRGKYNALPGDIGAASASAFGFTPRGAIAGEGDGNGLIEGINKNYVACGNCEEAGESAMFWVDLTSANGLNLNLIDGSFGTASVSSCCLAVTSSLLNNYFPTARLGNNNYIYVYNGGTWDGIVWSSTGTNFFGLSQIISLDSICGCIHSLPGLSVQQAYNIDKKFDDGLPQSGSVTATYLNQDISSLVIVWAAGGGVAGASNANAPTNASTPGSPTTCYDNGSGSGPQQYSLEISNGNNVNCALSFLFQ